MITRSFYLNNIERCETEAPEQVKKLIETCKSDVDGVGYTDRIKRLAKVNLERAKHLFSLNILCIKVHQNYHKKQ